MIKNDKNGKKIQQKVATEFFCEYCDYTTSRKYNWEKHLESKRHNDNKMVKKVAKSSNTFLCSCGKSYKHQSGLSRHKQICQNRSIEINNLDNGELESLKNIIAEKDKIIKSVLEKNFVATQNNCFGTQNNNFNINLYLNEKCSDALCIQDLIYKLKISMKDFLSDSKKSIPNILINTIKPMALTERPFHCTDLEKQEFYIKDKKNGWLSDSGEKVIKETQVGIINKVQENFINKSFEEEEYLHAANNYLLNIGHEEQKKILLEVGENVLLNANTAL